jgi:MoxR-like ATPase
MQLMRDVRGKEAWNLGSNSDDARGADAAAIADLRQTIEALEAEVSRVIVGQQLVVRGVTIALLAGGHVLLEGLPGLGKTLLVRTIARVSSSRQT